MNRRNETGPWDEQGWMRGAGIYNFRSTFYRVPILRTVGLVPVYPSLRTRCHCIWEFGTHQGQLAVQTRSLSFAGMKELNSDFAKAGRWILQAQVLGTLSLFICRFNSYEHGSRQRVESYMAAGLAALSLGRYSSCPSVHAYPNEIQTLQNQTHTQIPFFVIPETRTPNPIPWSLSAAHHRPEFESGTGVSCLSLSPKCSFRDSIPFGP